MSNRSDKMNEPLPVKRAYKKRARSLAILWTLLIFFLCFIPSREIPDVNLPLADKWVHFVLFGIFSFLWLLSLNAVRFRDLLVVLLSSIVFGWAVELLQGALTFLGRSQDNMDTLADSIGGLLGVTIFYIYHRLKSRQANQLK